MNTPRAGRGILPPIRNKLTRGASAADLAWHPQGEVVRTSLFGAVFFVAVVEGGAVPG